MMCQYCPWETVNVSAMKDHLMYSHANLRQPKFKTTIQPASKAVELETQLWQSYQLTHSQAKDVAEFIEQYCQEQMLEIIGDVQPVIKTDDIQDDVDVSYVIAQAKNYMIEELRQKVLSLKSKKEEA